MIPASSHVVVVGGGVFGCAVAFRLAQSGVRITLVEPDDIGAHASGKNAGNLNPLLNTPPSLAAFALASFKLHQSLREEMAALGCASYTLEPVQRILLARHDDEIGKLDHIAAVFDGHEGFYARTLDQDALHRLEPRLGSDMRQGLLLSGNMCLDGRAFTGALANGAIQLGAVWYRDRVRDLKTNTGKVIGVRTTHSDIDCDAVVFATGPWVTDAQQWLGLQIPVEPVKGQLLRMRLPGADLKYDLTLDEISLYRRGNDEIWLGVTNELVGLDTTPTDEGRLHLIDQAVRILPDIADGALLEHCASLRPVGPSGCPVVGQVPGWDNAYIANGGGAKGMLLSAGVAQVVHDLVLFGNSPIQFEALNLWRSSRATAVR